MLKPVALIQWSSMTTLISRLKLGKISQILNGKLRSCSFDYTLFGSKIFVFFLGLQRIYFLILYIIVQKTWTLAYFWNKTYNFFSFSFSFSFLMNLSLASPYQFSVQSVKKVFENYWTGEWQGVGSILCICFSFVVCRLRLLIFAW
jgi:hypothetical protein